MAEIESILTRLSKIFAIIPLRYVVVGGIAVIHYGHVRTTQDIDLIIEDNPTLFPQFLLLLETYEFDVMEEQFKKAYQEKTNVSIFDEKSVLRLDIKVATKKRELEVLNNAIENTLFGNNLYIAPIEYVLIGKIVYMGKISDIPPSELLEFQDCIDFLTLFYANEEEIDVTFLKEKANEMNLEASLEKLLSIKLE
ncbi:MAG: hypothetical protein BAJALOKI1v1_1410008 [Promethearchaeota archaeon]|nr:MAG: hypothetical protein BAJALOKI1v1_1410008 [Candidatus Lokiarchaeota archaeon]